MNAKILRISELEKWFLGEYLLRLEHIRRCKYLGLTPDESEYDLQVEAYNKEQELRELQGKEKLPDIVNYFSI